MFVFRLYRRLGAWIRHTRVICRTALDVETADDACRLLKMLHVSSSDDLAATLLRLFLRFPPTEVRMRKLSLLQQQLQGSGDMRDYAVTTVYAIATEALSLTSKNAVQVSGSTPSDYKRAHSF